jgi:hypothetical protein
MDAEQPAESRTETEDGVEVIVHGGGARVRLASRILERREEVSAACLRLLCGFLQERFERERDAFDLVSIEVLAARTPDGGDFSFRYCFTPAADPQEYGYTYFEVVLGAHEPPGQEFWPFRFTVGFH